MVSPDTALVNLRKAGGAHALLFTGRMLAHRGDLIEYRLPSLCCVQNRSTRNSELRDAGCGAEIGNKVFNWLLYSVTDQNKYIYIIPRVVQTYIGYSRESIRYF